jgi:hypothetical protein
MKHKLKMVGLIALASLAISAVAATAAQAAEFHSSAEHTILKATQSTTHVFTAGEGFGGISCETATFEGTSSKTTETEQTVTPTYANCKDSFGRTADVATNGCQYRFHATSGSEATYEGNTDIVCAESKKIEVKITSGGTVVCTVTIGAQNGIGPITFHNENEQIRVDSSANNVISTTSGGFFNCGISNGEHKGGSYDGDAITSGTDTTGAVAGIQAGPPFCQPLGPFEGDFLTESECTETKNKKTNQGTWERSIR